MWVCEHYSPSNVHSMACTALSLYIAIIIVDYDCYQQHRKEERVSNGVKLRKIMINSGRENPCGSHVLS